MLVARLPYKESEAENSPHQYFNFKTSAEVVNDVVIGVRVQIANILLKWWKTSNFHRYTSTFLKKKIRPFKTFLKSLISSFEANKYFFQWILAHSAIANDALKKYALEPHKVWKMFKTLYIVFVNDLGLYFLIILHCIKIVIILLVWPSKNCISITLYTKYNYNV